jgi:hypothetical protein
MGSYVNRPVQFGGFKTFLEVRRASGSIPPAMKTGAEGVDCTALFGLCSTDFEVVV